jgi:hypothetical protein
MLIWHADSAQLAANGFRSGNAVNSGAIHGLALQQADGFRNLEANASSTCSGLPASGCSDRGDAGDVYAGTTNNSVFSFATNPAAVKNVNGDFVGFAMDSIRQVVPGGTMAFRLRFGGLTVVRGSDTNAVVVVDGNNANVYRNLLEDGSSHTVSVADTQVSGNGRTRWRFASWSDAGVRTHTIMGSLAGATFTATLNRDFKLTATTVGGGTIASSPSVNLAGQLIAEGTSIQLTATPTGGASFSGWSGDTTSTNAILTLPMGRPYSVVATFTTALAMGSAVARPAGVMGATYDDTLRATGGTGTYAWTVTGGALPQGLALAASTGVVSGYPRETGNFSYQARVASGAQNQTQTFTLSVSAPTLATSDVVTQLLGPAAPLNPDQTRYLDFLGNNNSGFDIGDFLAWVKSTGAPLSADVMAKLARPTKGARP